MNKYKVYIVGDDVSYANFLTIKYEITEVLKEADIVIFTGGSDVDPIMYGAERNDNTYSNISRDIFEKALYQQINHDKQLAIGICRGSQFLTVMNGGL